jgi:multiple sugar transport system ATP-binding protein
MDEPLSNLDAKLRVQIRTEIAALQESLGTTTIYVTHDQVEAMTLGQRVAILRDGVLQQVAPPNVLYNQPNNIFVAGFLGNPGMNLFPVLVSQDTPGNTVLFIGEQRLELSQDEIPKVRLSTDQALLAGLRPEALVPVSEGPRLSMVVDTVESLGHEQLVYGHLQGLKRSDSEAFSTLLHAVGHRSDQLIARLPAGYSVSPGNDLSVGIDEARLYFFDIEGRTLHSPAEV